MTVPGGDVSLAAAMAKPSPPATAPAHRVGTLVYSGRRLAFVIFWLLLGDVVFSLMDQVDPIILPILLKAHGATDREIAIIIGSTAALVSVFVTPIVSYRSDRKRSPLGRRIPYLIWSTPFVCVFLAATPFAPEITTFLLRFEPAQRLFALVPVSSPVVLTFGVIVALYQVFHMVVASIYYYLFRDVVPVTHLGRFLALFRVFGALATFILQFWLVGLALTHSHEIFVGIALAYGVGFLLMCRFVREGEYPVVEDRVPAAAGMSRLQRWRRAAANFVAESFRTPLYRWIYATRIMIFAVLPVTSFMIFFPHRELGLSLDQAGKLMSWSAFAWIPFAYLIGKLNDRWGPVQTLFVALGVAGLAYASSFFWVKDSGTFLVAALLTGSATWVVMLSQNLLAQVMFHPARLGQLSAANALLRSIVIALLVSPLSGWFFDLMQGADSVWHVPLVGEIRVGPYRFIYLLIAAFYFAALVCLVQVNRHWQRLGGRAHYQPPL